MNVTYFIFEIVEGQFHDDWATKPGHEYEATTNGHVLVIWGESQGYATERQAEDDLREIINNNIVAQGNVAPQFIIQKVIH